MSLEVQKYLRGGGTIGSLQKEFSIRVAESPTDPLVILNYSQSDGDKRHPIARECRGLTLEKGTWEVAALGFLRFFNAGECPDLEAKFDWGEFTAEEKCDGSLMLMYWYGGSWRVNTRGSFARGEVCPGLGRSWEECFYAAMPNRAGVQWLDRQRTYVFEYCSRHNRVVRDYPEPTLYLLASFHTRLGREWSDVDLDVAAERLGVGRPARYAVRTLRQAKDFLDALDDPTFEGFVLRDRHGMRLKVKSRAYVALHRLHDNGNLFTYKSLVPLYLRGEAGEVLATFPEAAGRMFDVVEAAEGARARMAAVWDAARGIKGQKEFAQFVTKNTACSSFLFEARKRGVEPAVVWNERAEDFLVKTLKETAG